MSYSHIFRMDDVIVRAVAKSDLPAIIKMTQNLAESNNYNPSRADCIGKCLTFPF